MKEEHDKLLAPGPGRGALLIYTGDGKGKTTAALGEALRAVGQGFRVCVLQFLKGRETGEVLAAPRLAPELTLVNLGRPGRMDLKAPAPADLARVQRGWELARRAIASGDYDLVVLDEINPVLGAGLIPLAEALEVFQARPPGVTLILTGRRAPADLTAVAQVVTEMHPVKHYFKSGLRARRGIEW
ncbi:MAG: cob(I)yrinic acid a,c-diamide adenosyltransferase [Desulfobaccales bacterium]